MSVLYFLIPLAIILVIVALGAFFWAVKSDQFEDLERHGHSILFDDDLDKPTAAHNEANKHDTDD